jgi:hypothetical protein
VTKRMNDNDDNSESLKIINDQHNHSFILIDSHSAQRKIALTDEIRNDISRQLKIQIAFSQIFTSFRILNLTIEVNMNDSKNSIILNSMLKFRDIYNLKAKFRRQSWKFLTFIQALICELKRKD